MYKNLLLCTAACALFFSSFTFTSISTASGLSPETRHALEGMIKLPEQYRYAIAMANQYPQDTQYRMDSNGKLNQVRIKRSALQGQNNTATNVLPNTSYLNTHHQNTSNTGRITNVEGQETSLAHKENKRPVIDSNARQKRTSDKLSADVVSQHKDNSSLRTDRGITQTETNKKTQSDVDPKTNTASSVSKMALNTSAESHVKLPTKIENTPTADTESTSPLTDGKATAPAFLDGAANSKTLTPQIENSLVMPIAMFAAGISDVNNQNILLDNMQITMFEPREYQERSIFLSTYGNKNTFFSRQNSAQNSVQIKQEGVQKEQESVQAEQNDIQLEQEDVQAKQGGIHANIRYAALQAGAILIAREDQNISANFGFFGTYGKLSFTPKNAENSHRKMFDKWSLTAYGNIQHDGGIYASGFLSYGIFKENDGKDFIEESPKIENSKILGAAATIGQKLSTGFEGVILEPQAQLVYQRLILGSPSDNTTSSDDGSSSNDDNSKINISKPDQWLLRIGSRLTQNKGHAFSFYGKLNLIKTFSKNFQLAAMGSLIEGGFGLQAHLSPNLELHSDLSYQHKFKKVGISGINISAGMRYHF
ncbi:autotransporter outer membrane beta-barrel domain-containing protein [Bartonella sp. B1099]|uniref:autotransporter outer membrane beta-barrel domain-containing protein n=1 Tax=Bartonella sp. B1099 TaxID=2911422 RepID=UPI0020C4F9A6|nr:autotransporter outer membrane beta-barrel domain-containing protein [Bartonella sp. B1099]